MNIQPPQGDIQDNPISIKPTDFPETISAISKSKRRSLGPTQVAIISILVFICLGLLYGWYSAREKHVLTSGNKAEISKKVSAQIGASEFVVPQTEDRSRVVLKGGTGDFVFQKDRNTTYTGNIRLSDYAAQVYPYSVTAFISDRQDSSSKVYIGLFSDTRNNLGHLDSLLLFDLAEITPTATSTYTPHTTEITLSDIRERDEAENMPGDPYDDIKSFEGKIEIEWPDGSTHTYPFQVENGLFVSKM